MARCRHQMALLVCMVTAVAAALPGAPPRTPASFPPHLRGNVSAVVALLERVLPGSAEHFQLSLVPTCPGIATGRACFTLADDDGGGGGAAAGTAIAISGTSAAELTGGIGVYLREYCGMTYGWARGGGQRLFAPSPWPRVGRPVSRARSVPYSHVTQVCTHSYTLVWHGWAEWERFIDWMALAGHNSIVAPTGQEEIQYRIFTQQFGLTDMEVRNWTNGPGFLTWSRGQNSHGNSIAGPLPRSFMKSQWLLARQILERYRSLGIAGHQPAFAGYAPWALAVRHNDTRKTPRTPYPCTRGTKGAVDTAWVDGRDELFTRVADAWMAEIIRDFGSDHVWQMDGFFAGGTGWGVEEEEEEDEACEWSPPSNGTYLAGCARGPDSPSSSAPRSLEQPRSPRAVCTPHFASLETAQAACVSAAWRNCAGITLQFGVYQLRAGDTFIPQPPGKEASTSYRITNLEACKGRSPPPAPPGPIPAIDPVWLARARGAYGAVERADGAEARWLLQGWMLLIRGQGFGPSRSAARGPLALSRLKAYAAAAPPGNFILMDMDRTGAGQWQKWHGDWGLPFIWTSLHVFGGNDGIKGNLTEINAIPWQAPPLSPAPPAYDPQTQAVGVGYTPEGLDQNPAYYELLQESAFKDAAEPNITDWLVRRAHRRYGLLHSASDHVGFAWADIGRSGYAHDGMVHDPTAVGTLEPTTKAESWTGFAPDNRSPTGGMCSEWRAWQSLLAAAPAVAAANADTPASQKVGVYPETYIYDLVDIGREVLAQLTIPVALNFSDARREELLDAVHVNRTGILYEQLLLDLDQLLATDSAFMLGPWLTRARALGGDATDCTGTIVGDLSCADFMEWNARSQLTTWKPTPRAGPLGNPADYAKKQWSGLISGYYVPRVRLYRQQALADAAQGKPFDQREMGARLIQLAYEWQTTFGNGYPTQPVGDAVKVSTALISAWGRFFSACTEV